MIECNFPVEMCFPLVMQYNIQAKGGFKQLVVFGQVSYTTLRSLERNYAYYANITYINNTELDTAHQPCGITFCQTWLYHNITFYLLLLAILCRHWT